MKRSFFAFTALFLANTAYSQQAPTPTEVAVSLKTPDGHYVTQIANGGLDASATAASPKQAFVLVDLNGGKVQDGDAVRIKFDTSEWHEDKEKGIVHRVPSRAAKPEECTFKLRVKDKLIYLETPSGKFVQAKADGVVTVGDKKDATPFDIQAAAPAAAATSYQVILKFGDGTLVGMVAQGGLDATAKEPSAKTVFTLVDLNGGTLANGDSVRLLFGESQMHEDAAAGRIHRVAIRGSVEAECTFKILVVGQNVLLQAPGGKYVAAAEDRRTLVTTDKKDASSLLTLAPAPALTQPVK